MTTNRTTTNTWSFKLGRGVAAFAALGLAGLSSIAQADPATTASAVSAPAPAAPTTTTTIPAPAATAAPTAKPYGKKADKDFWTRLGEAELEQLATPVFVPSPALPPGSPAP